METLAIFENVTLIFVEISFLISNGNEISIEEDEIK